MDKPIISTDIPGEDGLIDGQWRLGEWHAMPMLTCVHCQWDTLEGIEAARARKAICPRCRPPDPPVKPTSDVVLVANKRGDAVNE